MTRWDEHDGGPPRSGLVVHNAIDGLCKARPLRRVDYLIVHRLSLRYLDPPIADHHLRGEDVVREFRARRELRTGLLEPYHAAVLYDASATQMIPLSLRGSHAGACNPRSLALAVVGLLDEEPMTVGQFGTTIRVLSSWKSIYPAAEIWGHTEISPSRSDPDKNCPGRRVSMHAIRTQVACQGAVGPSGWVV